MKKMKRIFQIFPVLLLALSFGQNQLDAQELRLLSTTYALGEIPGTYTGVGLGFENPLGKHFSMTLDLSLTYNAKKGSSFAVQPSIKYYFRSDQTGFFVGAETKLMKLKELDDRNEYPSNLYALGFNLGFKSKINEHWMFVFQASPHLTVGGPDVSDVAGINGSIGLAYRF